MRARVHRSSKREFVCQILQTKELVKARAFGNLLKKDSLVVGDFVELELQQDENEYFINSVEDRESEIFRLLVRENKKKVTAANVDRLVILSSVSKPAFKRGIIDRFLVRASQWGIRPCVVFNKMDQYDPREFDIRFEIKRLENLGVDCFEICALEGFNYQKKYLDLGIEELRISLEKKTAVFLGQSGVGKSKTISFLSGGEVQLKTKEVGKVGKGSHTTTWSEIIELPTFSLIDSPGIRSFSLEDINPDQLIENFPDLEEISLNCKFNNCGHEEKTKGCAFYSSDLDIKSVEHKAVISRLDSFKRIYEEISQTPLWQKKY